MKLLYGCQSETNSVSCIECGFMNFPHRCNVYREENHMEKIYTWEWIETPESSNIEMFAYKEGKLRVRFKNGAFYDYFDVPEKIYEDMKKAESKGKYLNMYLKGKYRTEKLE